MAMNHASRRQILSEALTRRAEAYRRWRSAADSSASPELRRAYEELAALECDRFEELVTRWAAVDPAATPGRLRPSPWSPPRGASEALAAGASAAESERRAWARLLRKTADRAPERGLVVALLEDARRARDLIGPHEPRVRRP